MVPGWERAAEWSAHADDVSRVSAAAQDSLSVFNAPGERYVDDDTIVRQRGSFTSGYRKAVARGAAVEAAVDPLCVLDAALWVHQKRYQSMLRYTAHGCYVGHSASQCLVAYALRLSVAQEVHAFHHHIGLEQGVPLLAARHHSAVVSRADKHGSLRGELPEQALQNGFLAKTAERCGHGMRMSESEEDGYGGNSVEKHVKGDTEAQ